MLKWVLIPLLFFSLAHAESEDGELTPFGQHHGYTNDVKEERNSRDLEMVMLPRRKEPASKPLSDIIFSERLSKEFQTQYAYRFGQTQSEQVLNTQTREDGYVYYAGANVTMEEYQKQQKAFGEYMTRRLIEHHVDQWAKNDPEFKQVYALKEKVSNLNVTVKKGYKVRWKYNFAGPNMEFKVENPYDVDFKVRMEMTGILSNPTEIIYSAGYRLTDKIYTALLLRQYDEVYQIVAYRPITKTISGSLTYSTDRNIPGYPGTSQDLMLVGISWAD